MENEKPVRIALTHIEYAIGELAGYGSAQFIIELLEAIYTELSSEEFRKLNNGK